MQYFIIYYRFLGLIKGLRNFASLHHFIHDDWYIILNLILFWHTKKVRYVVIQIFNYIATYTLKNLIISLFMNLRSDACPTPCFFDLHSVSFVIDVFIDSPL